MKIILDKCIEYILEIGYNMLGVFLSISKINGVNYMFYYANLFLALLWVIVSALSFDSPVFFPNAIMALLWLGMSGCAVYNYRQNRRVSNSFYKSYHLMSAAASIVMTFNAFNSFSGFSFFIMLVICILWVCLSWHDLYTKIDL